jgi:NMD protein affecting ribosome stability and mRNA decay
MTTATDDYCLNCEGENPQWEYDNICYECYIKKYPNLDTGMEEYPMIQTRRRRRRRKPNGSLE